MEIIQRGEFVPRSSPVDVQGRPAQPIHEEAPIPGQSGLHELGNALRTFNPRLENLLEKWQAQKRAEATTRYASELSQVGDNDLDKWRSEKGQGLSEEEQEALDAQFGIRLANARRRQEQFAIESGELDPANMDMDQHVKTLMESDIGTYGNAAFTKGYLSIMSPTAENLRQIAVKASGQRVRDEMEQGLFSLMTEAIQEVREQGGGGAAIQEALEDLREAHGPNTAFNIPQQRMDDLLMVALEGQARAGDEEVVTHLLETPAGKRVALSRDPDRAKQVAHLKTLASTRRQQREREDAFKNAYALYSRITRGESSQEEIEANTELLRLTGATPQHVAELVNRNQSIRAALLKEVQKEALNRDLDQQYETRVRKSVVNLADGTFGLLVAPQKLISVSGTEMETRTISEKQFRDDALETYIAERIERDLGPEMESAQAALQSDDPDVQQQGQLDWSKLQEKRSKRVLSVLHKNGITDYGKMRQTFQAGMFSARADGVAGPSTKAAYRLYKQAEAVADKGFAQRLAGSTSDFYEAVDVATREICGGNEEEAIALAHRVTTQPETLKWYTDLKHRGERAILIKNVRAKMEEGRGFFFSIEGQDGYIMNEVSKYAEFFAARGLLDKKQVIELSLKQFKQSHTLVNGLIVKNAEVNMTMPRRLPEVSNYATRLVAEQYPHLLEDEEEADQLALLPNAINSKLFEFISKRTSFGVGSSKASLTFKVQGKEVSVPMRGMNRRHMDLLAQAAEEDEWVTPKERKKRDASRLYHKEIDEKLARLRPGIPSSTMLPPFIFPNMTAAQLQTLAEETAKDPKYYTDGDQANIETALREREVLEQN